ncbi:MAG: hypothetical protein V7782_02755 [Psychromonas sp.]
MKKMLATLIFAITITGCANNNEITMHTEGEIIANQTVKADNEGTGEAVGHMTSLLVSDSDYRLTGWIIGGLIGDAIEEGNLQDVSELIIRLEDGKVITTKLASNTDLFKESERVAVTLNKHGELIGIKSLKSTNISNKNSDKQDVNNSKDAQKG